MKRFPRFVRRDLPMASARRVMLVMTSVSVMYQFMYIAMLSSALSLLPAFGMGLLMSGLISGMLWRLILGDARKYVTAGMKAAGIALSAVMLLCSLALVALYPVMLTSSAVWIVALVVLTWSVRETLARRLIGRRMRRTVKRGPFYRLIALTYLLSIGLAALILFSALPGVSGWQMLGGFALGALVEIVGLWRGRDLLALDGAPDDLQPETVRQMARELRQASAYNAYQRVYVLVLMALQTTMVLMYTFIGLSVTELFTAMLLAGACSLVSREVVDFILGRMKTRGCTQTLLAGLFLWMYGLFLFYRHMDAAPDVTMSYVDLCVSVCGLTVSVTALAELEGYMTDVAQFQLQNHMQGYSGMRAVSTEMAMLLGQMIGLILLTVLCMPAGMLQRFDLPALAGALRPVMAVPPLVLVAAAVVSVLRFPLNNRYFAKLGKLLTLEEEGENNPALKEQMESIVIRRHKNRYGVKLIIALWRPLYYHKVLGKENLEGFEDGSMVLICNHGEMYGPIVANLYLPVTFRPWVSAEMTDKDAIVERVYQGTMARQKWLPEKWKRPLVRSLTPVLLWVFHSLEAIPVYRGKPKELLRTFRETITAMQAGDNVLVFPENGEEHAEGEKGYVSEGVGKLYTGFAMIAPLYYSKTKKRAVFVPVYASKKLRRLTIGQGIVYDPEANANQEKQRIVDELMGQMQAMYEKEEAPKTKE